MEIHRRGNADLEDVVLGDDREVDGAPGGEALDAAHERQYYGQNRQEDLQHQACMHKILIKFLLLTNMKSSHAMH